MQKARERFLQYNRAGGKPLDSLKDRRSFEASWGFGNTPANLNETPTPEPGINVRQVPTQAIPGVTPPSTAPGEPPMPGRMNAGLAGVPPNPGEPSAVEPAGGKPFESQTATESPTSKTIDIPGYKGPAPNVPYVETPQEIHSQMMRGSPSDAQKVLEGWRDRQKPYEVEVPNGRLQVTPRQGGGGDFKFIASGKPETMQPGQVPIYPEVGKDGEIQWKMKVPGGGTATVPGASGKSFEDAMKAYTEVNKYWQKQGAIGESTSKVYGSATDPMAHAIGQGTDAGARLRTLGTMDTLVKSNKNLSMGPTSPLAVEMKQFMENFWPGSTKGVHDEDVINKLTSLLASESTQAVSQHRGTNFELQMFTRANPNLLQSREGMIMMMDILRQEYGQHRDIAKLAREHQKSNGDPLDWGDKLDEYYKDHPIIIHKPDGKGGFQDYTTARITSKEERDALPKGMGYITPDGLPGVRK